MIWDTASKDDTVCPKRRWVLEQLSDDEARDENGELPQGLRFHLARCESCRAVADRLQAVADEVAALVELEPDDTLQERAAEQARAALRQGAKLTGRVSIDDDLEAQDDEAAPIPMVFPPLPRYAAAACLALVLIGGGWLFHSYRTDSSRPAATSREVTDPTVSPRVPAVVPDELAPIEQPFLAGAFPVERVHDHLQAAQAEHDSGVQPAFLLPDPSRRGFDLSRRSFDLSERAMELLFIDTRPDARSTDP